MNAYLVLESKEIFKGKLSYPGILNSDNSYAFERAGEVVFNTSHFGYEEIATDPSYFSQIVVMTAPEQGNYGVSKNFWESKQMWIQGFVSMQVQESSRDSSWAQQLADQNIPILTEIDTRLLTLRLREKGTPWGAIVVASSEERAFEKAQQLIEKKKRGSKDWVYEVSRKENEIRLGEIALGPKVAVLDFGVKENILRWLCHYSREIKIFNCRTSYSEIMDYQPDALMLTNGPGDPSDVMQAPDEVKKFIGKLPIFGICMGHQILSLALGAKTFKLKFGHRGSNHPIKDKLLNQIYVSSQNHGYAVDESSLPKDAEVTQYNLNDNTVAGIYSKENKYLGIQYHPEACPGPHEANKLFQFFFEEMVMSNKSKIKNEGAVL
ncbi:MAG: glutamine-hydrolyzing carbamoyl-phosphate synthase small subunit [Bdellovibrionales bacterium]|nr:glutamine-hydrolyzing carbamoyl-phosphate synthase small subunit [Bdellovibrionales bacterium]